MDFRNDLFMLWLVVSSGCTAAIAGGIKDDLAPLIEASCIHCHDADTKTKLNLKGLARDSSFSAPYREVREI